MKVFSTDSGPWNKQLDMTGIRGTPLPDYTCMVPLFNK